MESNGNPDTCTLCRVGNQDRYSLMFRGNCHCHWLKAIAAAAPGESFVLEDANTPLPLPAKRIRFAGCWHKEACLGEEMLAAEHHYQNRLRHRSKPEAVRQGAQWPLYRSVLGISPWPTRSLPGFFNCRARPVCRRAGLCLPFLCAR